MSDTKFTNGGFYIHQYEIDENPIAVIDSAGNGWLHKSLRIMAQRKGRETEVAEVKFSTSHAGYGGVDNLFEARANAALFAAAPDLHKALTKAKKFIDGFEGDEGQEGIDDLLVEIRAALNKAVGAA